MCGIAGILGNEINNKIDSLDNMLKIQRHRGPDNQQKWVGSEILLGHNRLSIIDLHKSANQPMVSNCGRFIIVFNGEIYNYPELREKLKTSYSFKTNSDTEVLLAAYIKWDKQMLNDLNGMFAFVIWDNLKKKLFAARDRFGVKPFYYTVSNGSFYFASEIKTIQAGGIKKEKNLKVWAKYLAYGSYGLPDETFWNNIKQLPGGHYLEINHNSNFPVNEQQIAPVQWYNFVSNIQNTPSLKIQDLKERYLELLMDSVQLRFRADVPVGFNLSGGLDSSALLSIVNKKYPNHSEIEVFTFYSNHIDYDELPWVEQMIKQTGHKLNKCLFKVGDIPQLIEDISHSQDEPFGGFPTLAYSNIFKKAREKGIIVLLDGQGMDESWAGYDYYQTNTGFTIQGTRQSPVKPEALFSEFFALAEKETFPEPFDNQLQNLQYRDLFYTKIPRALRFNDRISMRYSTELREPFLDYRLVELAFAQNDDLKIKNGETKWLLRQLVKNMTGGEIALAPKRALQTPQREWISNEMKSYFKQKTEEFISMGFADNDKVLVLFNDYMEGNSDNSFFIWQWANLAILNK
jgi:asparagine synthase (glutamine-hydrolysing)